VVEASEGRALASKYNIPFLETSAKLGDNIELLFETIGAEIKKKILDSEDYTTQQNLQLN
jgi:Ras-related protein Rab-8A